MIFAMLYTQILRHSSYLSALDAEEGQDLFSENGWRCFFSEFLSLAFTKYSPWKFSPFTDFSLSMGLISCILMDLDFLMLYGVFKYSASF